MTTCEPSLPNDWRQTELPSMSSAADFHAKTCRVPVRVADLMASAAAYGPNFGVSLASYDPVTSSWKTCQIFLLADAGPVSGSDAFLETWPSSGLMRSGIGYRLLPLVCASSVIGSGLWPTPTVMMTGERRTIAQFEAARVRAKAKQGARTGNGIGEDLAMAVKRRWPGSLPPNIEKSGALNPPWVAWLMGFPLDWTDGVSAPSRRSVTP
jgi:hypothetical protein